MQDFADRYFVRLAAAFVRGKISIEEDLPLDDLSDADCLSMVERGLTNGLRLHKFKKTMGLARVARVLGALKALHPANLLDVGSGRGAFLWPLLNEFPSLPVTCVDLRKDRVDDIVALRRGGVSRLQSFVMSAEELQFENESFDVVTMLEVLEHMPHPEMAIFEGIRVARRSLIISVPSREDDNPEHIHLFGKSDLEKIIKPSGCRVSFEQVLNHLIAVVIKKSP